MTAPVILMLEDDAERLERFHAVAVRLGVDLISWPDAHLMLGEIGGLLSGAALIALDHDLEPTGSSDPGDGLMVAKHLATLAPTCPAVIHTSNGVRGDAMEGEFELAGWTYHRVHPFGDDWIEADWYRTVRRVLRKPQKPE